MQISLIVGVILTAITHSSRPGYTYITILDGNRRYVGSTANPDRRIAQHKHGHGANAVKGHTIKSVHVKKHASIKAARKAETRLYHAQVARHGRNNVRGAGNTRKFK